MDARKAVERAAAAVEAAEAEVTRWRPIIQSAGEYAD